MRRIVLVLAGLALTLFYARAYSRMASLEYQYHPQAAAKTFRDFADRNINFSRKIGVPDRAAEKLIINNEELNGWAFLYIHGFGAGRAEGEWTVDRLAREFNANVYYLRLPGHGTNADAHASAPFSEYLQVAEEAFLNMHLLGRRVVLIGTSTGGLVATYLASKYSDRIAGLIVASPLYDFANKTSRLLNFPGGLRLGQLVMGTERDAGWKSDPEHRKQPGYEDHWLIKQKFAALVNLNNLRRYVVKDDTFAAIHCPVLAIVYYKDAQHQDEAIDVAAVRRAMEKMGSSTKGKNRLAEIADGNHIMLSSYVRTDKQTIMRTMQQWLGSL